MSYVSLARKWRPSRFADLVGQSVVRTALENALSRGQVHQVLLFTGTRGVGKTTIARILARCLNCEAHPGPAAEPCGECSSCKAIDEGRFPDLFEIDAASRTKVDDTRELLDNIPYAPVRGRVKVYLIDEVHMLSKSSFNALLKTLEEPPPHVQFLLATTDPHKLPVTVISRCLQFHLSRIPLELMTSRLEQICAAEGVVADADGLLRVARAGDGSLRDALSLLDQAIAFGGGQVQGEVVAKMLGSIERSDILQILDALQARDAQAALGVVEQCTEQGLDLANVLAELARAWQSLALAQVLPESARDPETVSPELAARAPHFAPADVQVMYQIACHARRDLDWAPDPRSGLEMAILRMLAFLPEAAAGSVAPGNSGAGEASSASPSVAAPQADASLQAAVPLASTPASPADDPPSPVSTAESSLPETQPTPAPQASAAPGVDPQQIGSLERQFRDLPQVKAFDAHFGPGLSVRNVHARAEGDSLAPTPPTH